MCRKLSVFFALTLVMFLSACVSINRNHVLERDVKIEFIDISSNTIVTGHLDKPGFVDGLRKRIIESTKFRLKDMGIGLAAERSQTAAKLKYDIKNVITSSKDEYDYKGTYEIKYRAIFETADGSVIFDDSDEKNDSNLDDVIKDISKRVSKSVYYSYRDNTVK